MRFLTRQAVKTLTAAELKRRGMAAIEERLRHGPVHLSKRNKAVAVVLSMDLYARLSQSEPGETPVTLSAVQWLLNRGTTGARRKSQINKALHKDRDSWT